jgi:hypothetical protein
MSKPRSKVLYFTRHDTDLWDLIQSMPKGDANHEIRKALRQYFLGEAVPGFQAPADPAPAKTEAVEVDATKSIRLDAVSALIKR